MILGICISIQLKVINLENNGMNTSKKGEQLTLELKSLKKEEQKLQEEIEEIKNAISKYKVGEDEAILEEIQKYETLAGYTDVLGEGIEVKINCSDMTYNYDLLLSLINKLNAAEANAISINGERIVSNSYFHLKNDKLYINEVNINEPFVICAIGNPDTLASALQIKYGIVWEMEKYYDAVVEIEKKDEVKINAHSKETKHE
jgi:uncharacterized protein YlxW (UPF0749 family)